MDLMFQPKSDQDKWLDEYAFFCPGTKSVITPLRCYENREKPDLGDRPGYHKPLPCETCNDWPELVRAVQKREQGVNIMVGDCRRCHKKDIELLARGLCEPCYHYVRYHDELEQYPPIGRGKKSLFPKEKPLKIHEGGDPGAAEKIIKPRTVQAPASESPAIIIMMIKGPEILARIESLLKTIESNLARPA